MGSANGGTTVTVNGYQMPLVGDVTVLFGSSFSSVDNSMSSSSSVSCSAPAGSGVVYLSLYVGGYQLSANTYAYQYAG